MITLPDHTLLATLKEDYDQRRVVYRTRFEEQDCVTRVVRIGVPLALGSAISRLVREGVGSAIGLPDDIATILEGYRVRARLGPLAGVPPVLDCGLAPTGDGNGYPYVTTEWAPGRPLDRCQDLDADARKAVLVEVLRILARLHSQHAVFGDLKPHNIVVDGSVSLIDLDTLRSVGGPEGAVALTHRSPRYTAPEQEGEFPLVYLASDIFAFGLTMAELLGGVRRGDPGFPPSLEAPWDAVLRATLRSRPLDRPRADALLDYIDGVNDELPTWSGALCDTGTQRVPEPDTGAHPPVGLDSKVEPVLSGGTIRVEEPDTGPIYAEVEETGPDEVTFEGSLDIPIGGPPGAEKPAPGRELPIFLVASLGLVGLVGLVIVAIVGITSWMRLQDRQEANAQAALIRQDLETHKTVRERNDRATLGRIVERAGTNAAVAETADSLGVFALAWVWHQGWHVSGAKWDAERFDEGLALTRKALDAGPTPEALLAHALQTGAACRLSPFDEVERDRWCAESVEHADLALEKLQGRKDWRWMVVEATWAEVLTQASWAERLERSDDGTAADRKRQSILERCTAAEERLDDAPVNSEELIQDCMVAAGVLGEYGTWRGWADWLVDYRLAHDLELKGALRHVFGSLSPGCQDISLDPRGLPQWPRGGPQGSEDDLCRYVGFAVLGCEDKARQYRRCAEWEYWGDDCRIWMDQPGVPWDEVIGSIGQIKRPTCVVR